METLQKNGTKIIWKKNNFTMSVCFVCRKSCDLDVEKSVPVCDCVPSLSYHESCLETHFLAGNENCNKCKAKFRLAVRTQMVFSTQRFSKFVTIAVNSLFTLMLISVALFTCAPNDWIDLFTSKKPTYWNIIHSKSDASFLLFPPTDAIVADILYLVFSFGTPVFSSCLLWSGEVNSWQIQFWTQLQTFRFPMLFLTLCFISVAIMFHVFGFLHFLFYFCVGVITPEIFFELRPNWATFLAGPAGFVLVSAILSTPLFICIGLYYVGKYVLKHCCCCRIEKRVISLENKK